MKLNDIDYDAQDEVKHQAKELVEIPVDTLNYLLMCMSLSGQPLTLAGRLRYALAETGHAEENFQQMKALG